MPYDGRLLAGVTVLMAVIEAGTFARASEGFGLTPYGVSRAIARLEGRVGVRQGTLWTEMPNPKILGVEGVGRVLAVGNGVEGIVPGQRVAWVYAPT